MAKLPSFQFYPADWKKDIKVQSLSFEERGIWLEMLCLMHESEERGKLIINNTPMDEFTIARLIGCEKKLFHKVLSKLLSLGVAYIDKSGTIYNKRMVSDERLIQVRRDAGRLGGNPNLLKQKVNQNNNHQVNQQDKQIPTPSSSSSSSNSSSNGRVNFDIYELMRSKTLPEKYSDEFLKKQAAKFVKKYSGNIGDPGSLVNAWISNMEDEPVGYDPKKSINDFV